MNPISFPAVSGQWTLSGNRLRCRLPRRTIEVQAHAKLLNAVSDVCDGTHDWQSALTALSDRWERTAVQTFLSGLAANGLIVEASAQVADENWRSHSRSAARCHLTAPHHIAACAMQTA